MLSLSDCHMYVQYNTYQGILKLSLVRDYHSFNVRIQLYKINNNGNQELVKVFMKNCEEDPNNPNICSLISNTLEFTQTFNLKQCEQLIDYLSIVPNLEKNNENYNKQFTTNVGDLKMVLSFRNLSRMYYFFDSFVKNYFILDAAYNIYMQQISLSQNDVRNDNKSIETTQTTMTPSLNSKQHNDLIPKSKKEVKKNSEKTELDVIVSLALTPTIKSSAIHYIFTYYRFIDPKYCNISVDENNVLNVNIPKILPMNYVFDENYFMSIIESTFDRNILTTEKIDYTIKKLISLFFTNNESIINNSIYIMVISYLLFIYFLKYTSDLYPNDFKTKFSQFLEFSTKQTNMFNFFINRLPSLSDIKDHIVFNIKSINDEIFTDNRDTINKSSEQYKHLIPVSQERFADMIFDSIELEKSNTPQNFRLSTTRILDLNHIFQLAKDDNKTSVLFDTINPDTQNILNVNFINYTGENLTKEYKYFKEYLQNPSNLLLIKDNNFTQDIKLLFDILTQVIPNLTSDDNDLLKIYNQIVDELPHPENINHNTILKTLFTVVVPHQYLHYNITKFNDYFLT